MSVSLSGEMPAPHSSLKARGRHVGTGWSKWFTNSFTGVDWSHTLQRFIEKVRLLARDNDRYVEKVVSPATGQVLHDFEEPLSEHWATDRRGQRKSEQAGITWTVRAHIAFGAI